ncbi:TPA: HNH endonuclease [Serratia marcescens]|nr:HNH endonuclease [Serratia marcescens]HEJ9167936.1 HNH endonuclease [Serratia marcescens]
MKLTVDFSELIALGKKMLPSGAEFSLAEAPVVFDPIDIELSAGKEVSIDDLDPGSGLISYQGRQVLLYIRDHTGRYDAAIEDGENGKRFHIAWCRKLDEMRQKNRFERYHATNRVDGFFEIDDGAGRYQDADLKVCKLCLERLNYKGSIDYRTRQEIFTQFTLNDFFSHYSTCFRHMPKGIHDKANSGYVDNWKDISRSVREHANYKCNDCGVNLTSSRHLCDVHHKNGVKYDNSAENLHVVCKDCHRKQPFHEGMFISQADMATIQHLRSQQGLLKVGSWKDIYDLTDASIHGDINIMQHKGYPLPVLRFELKNSTHKTITTVEAAWPKFKIAINLTEVKVENWKIFTVGELVKSIQSGVVF